MITISDAYIDDIICNKVSIDKSLEIISKNKVRIEQDFDYSFLKNILLKPFIGNNEVYSFYHDLDINLNVLRKIILDYWDVNDLVASSKDICHHLYSVSKHPNIKDGDLIIAKIEDVLIDNTYFEALGIYKIERKDSFLEIETESISNSFLNIRHGVLSKNIDKACLVVFTKKEPSIFVIDKNSKETQYWIDDFLHVRPRKDEYSNTQNIMSMAKSFVTKELPKEHEMSKADQIELLNKSLDFFKSKDTFNLNDFANEVIAQPEVIKKFQQYKQEYEETNDIAIDNQFTISDAARKKQQRSYKRVIHLDKKIQIIIDGNSDNVEHGKDARGNYYKVYYNEEE